MANKTKTKQKRLLAASISKKKKEELSTFALMEKFMSQSGMTIQL